jgi:hypothetical protein
MTDALDSSRLLAFDAELPRSRKQHRLVVVEIR